MPRFPNIAEHAHSVSPRVYSNLEARARSRHAQIYPLHVGDTYRDPVMAARAERQLSAEHPGLHKYAPVRGEPVLIDAFIAYVRARHGETLDASRIEFFWNNAAERPEPVPQAMWARRAFSRSAAPTRGAPSASMISTSVWTAARAGSAAKQAT